MRVAVVLTARPSWAKLEPVCRALKARPDVELQIIACASALLERYGRVVDVVKAQDYEVAGEIWSTYEGANLVTSAKETGALLTELGATLSRLLPDIAIVCADRHEVLAAAQAAAYLHLPLLHLQGGERSGSIDDRTRDAITHLSDFHCVSTELARMRVYGLTGTWDAIHLTGCPSIDVAQEAQHDPDLTLAELQGTGPDIDLRYQFLVVLQHPVTNEMDHAGEQMRATLEAVTQVSMPRIVFMPGEDAGADAMAKVIREWRHTHPEQTIYTVKNFPPRKFLKLLTQAAVLVGNSSAGIRECSALGTPVVNVGTRQQGRERGPNVVDVGHDADAIYKATCAQIAHGPYPSSKLYGRGNAGERIAEVICGSGGKTSRLAANAVGRQTCAPIMET